MSRVPRFWDIREQLLCEVRRAVIGLSANATERERESETSKSKGNRERERERERDVLLHAVVKGQPCFLVQALLWYPVVVALHTRHVCQGD